MSDPQMPDGDAGIDATGVDADFVTNDAAPDPDEATPGPEQTTVDEGDEEDVDLSDLP
ncbi:MULTISPECIES: hypothetical protein [unclassified Microbacterium]|uniref:hypothetical protein n=1 Tax=unclassified Microbacterium TaxID=2609290 RepID=UPI0034493260